jgi:hypothetical protein
VILSLSLLFPLSMELLTFLFLSQWAKFFDY